MTSTKTQKTNNPDFHVFTVKKIGENEGVWTKIGAAWFNEDQSTLNARLNCIPFDGRLSFRKPLPRDEEEASDIRQ